MEDQPTPSPRDGEPREAIPEIVTIAIPTHNRSGLLRISLASALAQDYPNLRVVVLDNASTDDTESVVRSFNDGRVSYIRSTTNIGMVSNWNRAFEMSTSPFLTVLQDDDALLPSFVSESIRRLTKYPRAAFSYALSRYIDANGAPGKLQETSGDPEIVDGLAYLHQTVDGRGWVVSSSSVVFRASVVTVDRFDSAHSKHAWDFNLFVRLAATFNVVQVPKELVHVRVHSGQATETHWRTTSGSGPMGFTAERIDAVAYLLQSPRAQDPGYRQWLAERLLILNAQRSAYANWMLPDSYWSWNERIEMVTREIDSLVPAGESFILLDEDQWATGGQVAGRRAIPFPAKEGVYWGCPADDQAAIAEMDALRRTGVRVVIVGWPAFWWLDHYPELHEYLRSNGSQMYKNSRLLAFKLPLPNPASDGAGSTF